MAAPQALALIGAGRMGSALLRGWLKARLRGALHVVEPQPSDEVRVLAEAGKIRLGPPPAAPRALVIAVKPQAFAQAAATIRPLVSPATLVVSIMAGVRLSQLTQRLGAAAAIRAMPNTPGAIGQGITVYAASAGLTDEDRARGEALLAPLGEVHGPVAEDLMPAVTALSGSGPAYLFLLAETMAEAGEAEGLPKALAARLARRTLEGAARLMEASGESPEALRRAVTSPGGTTEAALDILMDTHGMPRLLREALRAAAARDRALAREAEG